MTGIECIRGDATVPLAKGVKMIAHVCNDRGGWGKGFVLAVSNRWPQPETAYRAWYRDRAHNDFGLGAAQFVQVEKYLWVANLIGQHGTRTGSNGPPVRYDAIGGATEGFGFERARRQPERFSVGEPWSRTKFT